VLHGAARATDDSTDSSQKEKNAELKEADGVSYGSKRHSIGTTIRRDYQLQQENV
jgi:hypothetical protein